MTNTFESVMQQHARNRRAFATQQREDKTTDCKDEGNESQEVLLQVESLANDDESMNLVMESVVAKGAQDDRAACMSLVLEWLADGDATFEDLDAMVQGLADVDEDGELSDDEEGTYNDLFECVVKAMVAIGVSDKTASEAINEESDEAIEELYLQLSKARDKSTVDDDELISTFAVGENLQLEALKKVIRDGKVTYIKKKLRKKRLSAAQRQALKKARRKANNSAARMKRAKSNRMRKSRGM